MLTAATVDKFHRIEDCADRQDCQYKAVKAQFGISKELRPVLQIENVCRVRVGVST